MCENNPYMGLIYLEHVIIILVSSKYLTKNPQTKFYKYLSATCIVKVLPQWFFIKNWQVTVQLLIGTGKWISFRFEDKP